MLTQNGEADGVSSAPQLLEQDTLADLCFRQNSTQIGLARFTIVYFITDDYLKSNLLELLFETFEIPRGIYLDRPIHDAGDDQC